MSVHPEQELLKDSEIGKPNLIPTTPRPVGTPGSQLTLFLLFVEAKDSWELILAEVDPDGEEESACAEIFSVCEIGLRESFNV
jgi:hypothetical protein